MHVESPHRGMSVWNGTLLAPETTIDVRDSNLGKLRYGFNQVEARGAPAGESEERTR